MDYALKEMLGSLALILAAQIVVFAVIVVVLRKLLLSDTMNAVKRLRSAEGDLGKKEESMRQRMETYEQEFTRKKTQAEEDLKRQKDAVEQDLARMRERLKAEAKMEADKIIGEAQLQKEKLREQIEREAQGKAVEYSGRLFNLVIGNAVTEKMNEVFIEELLTALADVDETTVHVEASEADFIASHKLDPAQKSRLEDLLRRKFGVELKVSERVDGKLLAGLIIKLGSLEIDGSLASRFQSAVAEMKKGA